MGTKDNQFLSSLNEADMALLSPHLREMVDLPHTRVLFEQGGRIERLYFPVSGVVSFVVAMSDGEWVEAGMVGRDGVVGGSAGLDGARALNRAIVQSPGMPGVKREPKSLVLDGSSPVTINYKYPASNVYLKQGRWPHGSANCICC